MIRSASLAAWKFDGITTTPADSSLLFCASSPWKSPAVPVTEAITERWPRRRAKRALASAIGPAMAPAGSACEP